MMSLFKFLSLLSPSTLITTDGTALGLQTAWGVQDRQRAQSPPTGARLPAPSQESLPLATKVAVHWPPGGRKLPLRPAVHKAQDGADMLLPATSPGIQMFYFSFSERIRQGSSLLGGRAASRVCSGTIGVRGYPPPATSC